MEFEPIKYYQHELKDKVNTAAAEYFEQLTADSGVDVGENIASSNRLETARSESEANKKTLNRWKGLRGFCWFLFVVILIVFAVGLIVSIVTNNNGDISVAWLVTTIVLGIADIGIIVFIFTYLKKKIDQYSELQKEHDARVDSFYAECYKQVLPLFSHLDQTDFVKIVNDCVPTFSLDETFSTEKAEMLAVVYGYDNKIPDETSIYGLYSGNVKTNPFVKFRTINHRIYNKVYVGTLHISWTETHGFGENQETVTHSETLTAEVIEPAPEYSKNAYLVYGNNAAPDLNFSREPSGLNAKSSEKDIDKLVKSKSKKLEKMTETAITKGGTFQAMANTRFEALFGAFDRDNEVQYRLLFTPLAQQNMTALITAKQPYTDDFSFSKRGKINIISSTHSAFTEDFEEKTFLGETDIRKIKKHFISSVNDNFSALYFDLCPLLSIPLYQQTEAGKFDITPPERHVTDAEAEAVVNHMDGLLFKNPEANITDQLLKVGYAGSVGNSDIFDVDSLSYLETPEVAYIPKMGGDGCIHDVPVHYFVYTEKRQRSRVCIRNYEGTKSNFSSLMNEKKYFEEEKDFYTSAVKNRKCVGFVLPTDYNYSKEEDERIDEIVSI